MSELELKRDRVLTWLAEHVPVARIKHILGVEQMAIDLATHYQADVDKAAIAGLMHDLAKYFQPLLLLQMANDEGLEIDSILSANPHLLHADISAIIARDQFGIVDQEICLAIADHTLGRPGMGLLSCIIFLADSLEVGRGNTPELETLRQISRQNLYQAVWLTCDYSLRYLLKTHLLIHPRTVLTRNWFLHQTKSQSRSDFPIE